MKATIKDGTIHLEGTGSEIAGVLATLVEEPESCSITGRSCDTCKHQAPCYGCGVHFANYEPAPPEQNCNTCRHPGEPSEVLRVMMEAKGWDVNDLEAKTGIVAGYWQDIVDGKVHINKHDARRLSRALGVPLDYWEPSWVFADGGYVEPANRPHNALSRQNEGAR